MNSYHRVYSEIDLEIVRKNLIEIKNKVGDSTKIMPVIKADGYGHGAIEIAKYIKDLSDYFAVATIDEALELRNNGIELPVLILSYVSPDDYKTAILNNVFLTVFDTTTAFNISKVAEEVKKEANIHIAIDTGMSRIGFSCIDENIDEIIKINRMPYINIDGIFTHFAVADEADNKFTDVQFSRFRDMTDKIENAGVNINVKHICNSAGIMSFNDYYLDMVRAGIIIYGLYPSDEVNKDALKLVPALSLKSHVICIKNIEKGVGISYGLTYTTDKPIKIATIHAGYADGVPRMLSNKGRVLIQGKSAKIVGRVCMDQFMVDITNFEDVKVGDTVTIIGTDGNETISADEIAKLTGTINYEITCGLTKRVFKIYKRGQ